MIHTVLKYSIINTEPKLLNYKKYKTGNFKEDFNKALLDCRNSYDDIENTFNLKANIQQKRKVA